MVARASGTHLRREDDEDELRAASVAMAGHQSKHHREPSRSVAIDTASVVARPVIGTNRDDNEDEEDQNEMARRRYSTVDAALERRHPSHPSQHHHHHEQLHCTPSTLEVDYDRNLTELYRAITDQDWERAARYCRHDQAQAATWVVRHHRVNGSQDDTQEDEEEEQDAELDARDPSHSNDSDHQHAKPSTRHRVKEIMWRFLPLHSACARQPPAETIAALLHAYPDGVKCRDDQGMYPLHYAAGNQASREVIRQLLLAFPEAAQITDPRGMLPVHYAACWGPSTASVIDLLMIAAQPMTGAGDLSQATDCDGNTPLDLALEGEYPERDAVVAALQKWTNTLGTAASMPEPKFSTTPLVVHNVDHQEKQPQQPTYQPSPAHHAPATRGSSRTRNNAVDNSDNVSVSSWSSSKAYPASTTGSSSGHANHGHPPGRRTHPSTTARASQGSPSVLLPPPTVHLSLARSSSPLTSASEGVSLLGVGLGITSTITRTPTTAHHHQHSRSTPNGTTTTPIDKYRFGGGHLLEPDEKTASKDDDGSQDIERAMEQVYQRVMLPTSTKSSSGNQAMGGVMVLGTKNSDTSAERHHAKRSIAFSALTVQQQNARLQDELAEMTQLLRAAEGKIRVQNDELLNTREQLLASDERRRQLEATVQRLSTDLAQCQQDKSGLQVSLGDLMDKHEHFKKRSVNMNDRLGSLAVSLESMMEQQNKVTQAMQKRTDKIDQAIHQRQQHLLELLEIEKTLVVDDSEISTAIKTQSKEMEALAAVIAAAREHTNQLSSK